MLAKFHQTTVASGIEVKLHFYIDITRLPESKFTFFNI